jgi:hypothetical protein
MAWVFLPPVKRSACARDSIRRFAVVLTFSLSLRNGSRHSDEALARVDDSRHHRLSWHWIRLSQPLSGLAGWLDEKKAIAVHTAQVRKVAASQRAHMKGALAPRNIKISLHRLRAELSKYAIKPATRFARWRDRCHHSIERAGSTWHST